MSLISRRRFLRIPIPVQPGNFTYLERIMRFLLWSRGGFRIHFDGPAELCKSWQRIIVKLQPANLTRKLLERRCSIIR